MAVEREARRFIYRVWREKPPRGLWWQGAGLRGPWVNIVGTSGPISSPPSGVLSALHCSCLTNVCLRPKEAQWADWKWGYPTPLLCWANDGAGVRVSSSSWSVGIYIPGLWIYIWIHFSEQTLLFLVVKLSLSFEKRSIEILVLYVWYFKDWVSNWGLPSLVTSTSKISAVWAPSSPLLLS